MRIQAWEKWLDEGWTPWRIVYGSIGLIATGVTVYGYASHPHHPGAVWWLLGCVGVIALWALGELLRWRTMYRRLLAAQQASSTEPLPQPVSTLLAEGKGLRADIGGFSASWGPDRFLPGGLPGKITRWEGNVSVALTKHPDIDALFVSAPDINASAPIAGQAYARIEHQIKILEKLPSDEDSKNSKDDLDIVERIQTELAGYYAERIKGLSDLQVRGRKLQFAFDADAKAETGADLDDPPGSSSCNDVQKWEAAARNALMYWGDLWRSFSESMWDSFAPPTMGRVQSRLKLELETLQLAINRLEGYPRPVPVTDDHGDGRRR